jgi:hypothetical protein
MTDCPILQVTADAGLPPIAIATRARLIASHFGQFMAARYNGPMFLVGSALSSLAPRDIDLRVIVADKEFCGRYGLSDYWLFPNQAWVDDMAKRNGELARDFGLNADFQVYPASYCINGKDGPRLLIASPTDLSHIVKSVAWWFDPPPVTDEPELPNAVPTVGDLGEGPE